MNRIALILAIALSAAPAISQTVYKCPQPGRPCPDSNSGQPGQAGRRLATVEHHDPARVRRCP